MLKFSSALQTLLSDDTTKTEWATTIKTALGATRRVRCFRDASSTATDPATTGAEFCNMAATGEMTITGGRIVGFGVTSDQTINLAADLATGASVLRIEGGGHWVEGSLGLTGSTKDFTFTQNPTGGATGYAFDATASVSAPPMLGSGTGPAAPFDYALTPNTVTIEDWTTGAAVPVGVITFNDKQPNWVFDDPEIAGSMGDVLVKRSTQSVTFGGQEFGAVLFGMNGSVNSVGTAPVYQVLIGMKPTVDNWNNYPATSGYVAGVTDTFPASPFKAVIRAANDQVLHTHEMRDGLAIGSPLLSVIDHANRAMRFPMNCAMMLPWQSSRPKLNANAAKFFPGVEGHSLRPTVTRKHYATNGVHSAIYGMQPNNSYNHWWAMPKWAVPGNATSQAADTYSDPYLYDINSASAPYGGLSYGKVRITGWGYEPASISGHDQMCGPGGPRADRGIMPTPIVIYMTNQNFVRPRNNDPIVEMVDHWNLAYFNLPYHYLRNAKTFDTLPMQEVLDGAWAHGGNYYGGNDSYVDGGTAKSVPQFVLRAENSTKPFRGAYIDKNGRMPWNGAASDGLHSYWCPGWGALLFNSPMHAYSEKQRLISAIMVGLADSEPNSSQRGMFLTRTQAWRLLHYTMGWKLSSNDAALGMNRAAVAKRMQLELEHIYDTIYKPAMIDNDTSPYSTCLRNLGIPLKSDGGEWVIASAGLTFYLAHALQLMKQTGFWAVMRATSTKCDAVLLFMLRCMDLYTVDWMIDTHGRKEGQGVTVFRNPEGTGPGSKVAADNHPVVDNWAQWAAIVWPRNGVEDWVRLSDGTSRGGAQDVAQFMRFQYVKGRKHYFADIPVARGPTALDTAIAMYQECYDFVAADVAAKSTPYDKTSADFANFWPPADNILPPTVLGP